MMHLRDLAAASWEIALASVALDVVPARCGRACSPGSPAIRFQNLSWLDLDQGFRTISAIDAASGRRARSLYRRVDEIFRAVKRNYDAGPTVLIVEGMAECPGISDHANMLQIGRLLMQGSAIETKVNPDVRRACLGL